MSQTDASNYFFEPNNYIRLNSPAHFVFKCMADILITFGLIESTIGLLGLIKILPYDNVQSAASIGAGASLIYNGNNMLNLFFDCQNTYKQSEENRLIELRKNTVR